MPWSARLERASGSATDTGPAPRAAPAAHLVKSELLIDGRDSPARAAVGPLELLQVQLLLEQALCRRQSYAWRASRVSVWVWGQGSGAEAWRRWPGHRSRVAGRAGGCGMGGGCWKGRESPWLAGSAHARSSAACAHIIALNLSATKRKAPDMRWSRRSRDLPPLQDVCAPCAFGRARAEARSIAAAYSRLHCDYPPFRHLKAVVWDSSSCDHSARRLETALPATSGTIMIYTSLKRLAVITPWCRADGGTPGH
jgi:hypothetical protein